MAGIKVVTRKITQFQGEEEEFSNVYYFGDGITGGARTSDQAKDDMIREVIATEKPIFANDVLFLGGAAYDLGPFGGPVEDSGFTVELNGNVNPGGATQNTTMYRELAIDVRFLLGGRRYLRSLLHTCNPHGLDLSGIGRVVPGSGPLVTFCQKMIGDDWPGGFTRMAPNGDRPTTFQINGYMEHRQFHRYRKRS